MTVHCLPKNFLIGGLTRIVATIPRSRSLPGPAQRVPEKWREHRRQLRKIALALCQRVARARRERTLWHMRPVSCSRKVNLTPRSLPR